MQDTHIQGERFGAVDLLIAMNANEGITLLVEGALETDDNELEGVRSLRLDIASDLGYVGIIQRRINFVQHKERCRLVTDSSCKALRLRTKGASRGTDLCMANSRARAATVFSPPDSCSISRNLFIGGIAWYLMPLRYGS